MGSSTTVDAPRGTGSVGKDFVVRRQTQKNCVAHLCPFYSAQKIVMYNHAPLRRIAVAWFERGLRL